jgi:hypothetical protein
LAIPSDGYTGQRIVVPVDEQKALIKCTHAEIHLGMTFCVPTMYETFQ